MKKRAEYQRHLTEQEQRRNEQGSDKPFSALTPRRFNTLGEQD